MVGLGSWQGTVSRLDAHWNWCQGFLSALWVEAVWTQSRKLSLPHQAQLGSQVVLYGGQPPRPWQLVLPQESGPLGLLGLLVPTGGSHRTDCQHLIFRDMLFVRRFPENKT